MRVTVETDIDLGDIDTEDLMDELKFRGERGAESLNVAVATLKMAGLPQNLVDQLDEWARQPIVTRETLKQWMSLCEKEAA